MKGYIKASKEIAKLNTWDEVSLRYSEVILNVGKRSEINRYRN